MVKKYSNNGHRNMAYNYNSRGYPLKTIKSIVVTGLPVKKRQNSQPFISSSENGISMKKSEFKRKTAYSETKETEYSIKFLRTKYQSSQPSKRKSIMERIKEFFCSLYKFLVFLVNAAKTFLPPP